MDIYVSTKLGDVGQYGDMVMNIACRTIYVTGFAKTVPKGTRIEIPFIAWHES